MLLAVLVGAAKHSSFIDLDCRCRYHLDMALHLLMLFLKD